MDVSEDNSINTSNNLNQRSRVKIHQRSNERPQEGGGNSSLVPRENDRSGDFQMSRDGFFNQTAPRPMGVAVDSWNLKGSQ